MSRTDLLEQADNLRQEIESQGFRVTYFSGPRYTVTGIPAVGGTNEQLVVLNAQNTAQLNAWNVQLADLWTQLDAIETGMQQLIPVTNPWGSAGKEVPAGFVVDYNGLFQMYQQAKDSQNWTLANEIATQINAITAAGPQVVLPPPTIGGAIPPGPTSNTSPTAPTTTPVKTPITLLPPVTATGGQPSVGSPVPEVTASGATVATMPNNNTMWLLAAVAVVVAIYLFSE